MPNLTSTQKYAILKVEGKLNTINPQISRQEDSMIVKVDWAKPNSDGFKMYHVWECSEYFVEVTGYKGDSINGSSPSNIRLMLDCDKHDIVLNGGDTAYVMNDSGKTIEVVRT